MIKQETTKYVSNRNACKLCAPLGAGIAFKGIKGCVPLVHGSQGCTTYIRRYLISHYKEPVDMASSNFSEVNTIFGGEKNFGTGLNNVISQYNPEVVGVSSTCLSETIGEDIPRMIHEYTDLNSSTRIPVLVNVSTPSYRGTHIDGFHDAVCSTVSLLAIKEEEGTHINIFPGFISPEDIRHLKDIFEDFGIDYILFPDYSDTLDGSHWKEYQILPEGGTPVSDIRRTGSAAASIELGYVFNKGGLRGRIKDNKTVHTGGEWLELKYNLPDYKTGMPVGIKEIDKFFELLKKLSGKNIPERYERQRGRLVDSYIDGHKYLFGKKAIVYGEEDLVIGLVSFLQEVGIDVVLVASGGESGILSNIINEKCGTEKEITVISGADFETINTLADSLKPDILIGNSKGYYIARRLAIPLVRVGFPIHDRIGVQRIRILGYEGTQQLFDRVTNALIEYKQENSPVGYKYL